ncbi:hypothetical protein I3760_09G126000 [Carya illinoinensis]|nr:hypothetical protein I3760_09G126000 [Carya illinoinensis]
MGNKVDYDDDLEMTNLRLEELGSSLIKSKKSDGAVIEEASMKETLDILEGRVEDDDGKTEEFDSFKQKMNVNSRKKGLRDWVKDCKEFDEEKTILIGMMVQAVQVGIQLSNLIVDFVFMMSWQEDIAAKIGEFKSEASNWVIENGRNNSMVIDRIVTLLAMADAEVSHLKKSKREVMIKNKGWTVTALDQGSRVGELLNLFVEQVGKRLLDQLIEISLRLEAIMIVGESSVLALEYDLDECEEDAERIREDISTLKIAFPLKLGIRDSKMIRTRDIVASNIYELWNGLLTDSSDEEQREQPHEVEDDDHPTV